MRDEIRALVSLSAHLWRGAGPLGYERAPGTRPGWDALADDRSTVVPAMEGDGPPSAGDGPIGQVVGGYLVQAVAGSGGMGVVYRAHDTELGRTVALKLIAPERAGDARLRELFVRESLAAAGLEHPNVIPIYRAGEDDGRLFIAMRFVEGASLQDLIVAAAEGMPPGRAARIVARVADALDAAHARGLVHRDVKPGNILIADPDGEEHVYLPDFGLSVHGARRPRGPTASWAGTLAYLAPEQIRGEALDGRTDVYALGCVLFHALTGRAPFPTGDEEAALAAHLEANGRRRRRRSCPACRRRSTTSCARPWPRGPRTASRPPASSAGPPSPRATTWRCSSPPTSGTPGPPRSPRACRSRSCCRWSPWPRRPGAAARASGRPARARCWSARAASATGPATASRPRREVAARDRAFRLVARAAAGRSGPGRSGPGVPRRAPLGRPARRRRRRAGGGRPRPRPARRRRAPRDWPAAGDAPPYRGLEAFREEDADIYFGREQDVAAPRRAPALRALRRRARRRRAAARARWCRPACCRRSAVPRVAGGSGEWRVLEILPGARPLAALAAQLAQLPGAGAPSAADLAADERALDLAVARALDGRPADERALLFVDQLEEVFTLCSDEGERAAFLGNLVYAATIPGGRDRRRRHDARRLLPPARGAPRAARPGRRPRTCSSARSTRAACAARSRSPRAGTASTSSPASHAGSSPTSPTARGRCRCWSTSSWSSGADAAAAR